MYLVAFGQSRHRAWVVGQRPHGCWLGSRGWPVCRGPLGGSLEASWGPFWGLLGPHSGLVGASWGVLGGSWGPLGASLGPLGASLGHLRAEDSIFQFFVPLLGPCWARLESLLGRLGRFLGRLGASLGRLGAVLGASRAVLERSWGPLGPSWSVGKPKGRGGQNH